jgi:hypothetical protein
LTAPAAPSAPAPATPAPAVSAPASAEAPQNLGPLVRLLGVVLAVLVTDPTSWGSRPVPYLTFTVLAAVAAWFGADPLTARPVAISFRWRSRLSRHRNTAFAVMCVVLAAFNRPPDWLAGCDVALLLTYLLCVDALAAGPPAVRLLRRPLVLCCAFGGSALALAAALVPVTPSGSWARLLAALALAGAAAAVVAALAARARR